MGFDLSGKDGSYLQRSVWSWRPLWALACKIGADVLTAEDVAAGQYNDGHTIDAAKAAALGRLFHDALNSGEIANLVADYERRRLDTPLVPCPYCDEDGMRRDLGATPRLCNACHGAREMEPIERAYTLTDESVCEFTEFLLGCEGFEIW